jgi:hypothetical protein
MSTAPRHPVTDYARVLPLIHHVGALLLPIDMEELLHAAVDAGAADRDPAGLELLRAADAFKNAVVARASDSGKEC